MGLLILRRLQCHPSKKAELFHPSTFILHCLLYHIQLWQKENTEQQESWKTRKFAQFVKHKRFSLQIWTAQRNNLKFAFICLYTNELLNSSGTFPKALKKQTWMQLLSIWSSLHNYYRHHNFCKYIVLYTEFDRVIQRDKPTGKRWSRKL